LILVGAAGAVFALISGPRASTALSISGSAVAPLWKAPTTNAAQPPAALVGDGSLRGELALSRLRRRGERYQVALPGDRTARLTLDPAIQTRATEVLEQSRAIEGAIVVMGIDGRVLALAGLRASSPKKVDYNLPVKVWAPAASVFKLVTAAALLESGVKRGTEVCYRGGFRSVERAHLQNDRSRGASCGDLGLGISKSQNAIIANLAHNHLDKSELARAARKLGFGESADLAPDFAIDVEANRIALPDGDLERARVAAGFWSTELSPLGGAMVASAIATGGIARSPRIVDAVIDGGAEIPVLPGPTTRVLPQRVAATLTSMMTETCATGTARKGFHDLKGRPFLDGAPVAGKTGSLSVASPSYRAYSWFVGFAPADEPRVVISVLLANPETWHLKAHTAARLVLEKAL
jgi:cell division protein FtsI/penicillin-binding protein 2